VKITFQVLQYILSGKHFFLSPGCSVGLCKCVVEPG